MRALSLVTVLIFSTSLFAQIDSLEHDGIWRSYIVYTPGSWQQGDTVPLVINMHGFGSTAEQQEIYSLMDFVADTGNFIVVYPQGLNNSWDFTGFQVDDLGFIDALIDKMHADFRVDLDRVYACGMSNGGFMSYSLACQLSDRIVAIASVAGSMSIIQSFSCSPGRAVPVLEVHGTADTLVSYGGGFGVSSTSELISTWRSKNGCTSQVDSFDFPDLVPFDQCTVTGFRWENCDENSEVWLYRVNNGGHTWPGTFPTVVFGPTNLDIYGSGEIWNFFNRFSLAQPTSGITNPSNNIHVSPNPAGDVMSVTGVTESQGVQLISVEGRVVRSTKGSGFIPTGDLSAGPYVLVVNDQGSSSRSLVIIQH